jgi:putative phage-type endonuclease
MTTFKTNTAYELGNAEPGSLTWLAMRHNGIGGSDISAVLGVNQYRSTEELLEEKLGPVKNSEPNDAMIWGTWSEPNLVKMFKRYHPGAEVETDLSTFAAVGREWMIANPDAIWHSDKGPILLELKTGAYKWHENTLKVYSAQVQWYLHILGIETAILCGWVAGKWIELTIEYDETLAFGMESLAADFVKQLMAIKQERTQNG